MPDPAVTIYHNPACGTSRNVLALLRHAGLEPTVIAYLETPPKTAELRDLAARMGLSVRDLLRRRGTPYEALGLDDPALSEDALLDAMQVHPLLINRPIVVTPEGVRLCRPAETVFDLLPPPDADLPREDGSPLLVDERIAPGAELVDALMETHLLADDLQGADRCFFRFRRLGGAVVGYGGFERYGGDALLRSMVVLPPMRGTGIGRNLARLLLRRAFDDGARQAYALTTTAAAFFEKIGFAPLDRGAAPASIRATRQAAGLCVPEAMMLARRIDL